MVLVHLIHGLTLCSRALHAVRKGRRLVSGARVDTRGFVYPANVCFPWGVVLGIMHACMKFSRTTRLAVMDPTDYEVVDSVERLSEVVPTLFHLATNPPSLYIDLEGRDLCRHGKISLISIFAAPLQKVFLIDVHVLGADAVGSPSESGGRNNLRILLENKSIPKVLFDCRNDADALYNLFKVDLGGAYCSFATLYDC